MAVRDEASRSELSADRWLAPVLLTVAAVGWWWSAVTAADMGGSSSMDDPMGMADPMGMGGAAAMSFAAFLVAWVAMMAAMMLPAVLPVVRLYSRAAARGNVAPVAVFVAGYGAVWSAIGLPVYLIWKRLEEPLADPSAAVGRLAGGVLLAAAVYQLSPLKAVCLKHCRSPLSFFMRHTGNLRSPLGALRAGAGHGLFCLGCCWMLMAVLIAFGTMDLLWMAAIALLILLEKVTPVGERVATVAGVAFLGLGALLLIDPLIIRTIT